MIATIRQRLQEEGYFVSISKLCQESGWVFLGARCITTQSRPYPRCKGSPRLEVPISRYGSLPDTVPAEIR